MEFTKEIHFSDNLKERQTVKITYSGELFKNNSDSVTIVYGYGENWEHTTEQEMEKTETGFTTDIEIKDFFDKFNFCFRNSNYIWDNNNNCNYTADISPLCLEDLLDPQEEVNESLIIELLDNLLNENIDYAKKETDEDNKQQILEDILTEQTLEENEFIWTENFDMNKLVENILNPVVNCAPLEETTEEFEENTTTNSVSAIETTPEPNSIFDELFEDDGNVTLVQTMDEIAENIEELYKEQPKQTIEYFSESTIKEDSKTEYFSESTIDENCIEPIEPSLLENLDNNNNNTSLVTTASSEDKYLVSPRQLSRFYMIKKKVKIALYKLFVAIPKILSGEFDKSKE